MVRLTETSEILFDWYSTSKRDACERLSAEALVCKVVDKVTTALTLLQSNRRASKQLTVDAYFVSNYETYCKNTADEALAEAVKTLLLFAGIRQLKLDSKHCTANITDGPISNTYIIIRALAMLNKDHEALRYGIAYVIQLIYAHADALGIDLDVHLKLLLLRDGFPLHFYNADISGKL